MNWLISALKASATTKATAAFSGPRPSGRRLLVLAALAALIALAARAEEILGPLLALLNLVAETSAGLLVSEVSGLVHALVDLVWVFAGEFLGLVGEAA